MTRSSSPSPAWVQWAAGALPCLIMGFGIAFTSDKSEHLLGALILVALGFGLAFKAHAAYRDESQFRHVTTFESHPGVHRLRCGNCHEQLAASGRNWERVAAEWLTSHASCEPTGEPLSLALSRMQNGRSDVPGPLGTVPNPPRSRVLSALRVGE